MGFFSKVTKTVKKGWKDALGWADDDWMTDYVLPSAVAIAATVAGQAYLAPALVANAGMSATAASAAAAASSSAVSGAYTAGASMHAQAGDQRKAMRAQAAAAQKIADAQNPANLVTAVTPNASMENAQVSEENMANEARRRYSFSKTLYKNRSRLGKSGSEGNSATRITLG